jgi:hypothetical protein
MTDHNSSLTDAEAIIVNSGPLSGRTFDVIDVSESSIGVTEITVITAQSDDTTVLLKTHGHTDEWEISVGELTDNGLESDDEPHICDDSDIDVVDEQLS